MAIERIHSIGDFRTLQQRLTAESDPHRPVIVIPAGTCGQASGANDLIRIAKRDILSRGLSEKVRLRVTGCHGYCQMEPSVLIKPRGTFYPRVNVSQMSEVVDAVASGKVLDHLLFRDPETGDRIEKQGDVPFFKRQTRSILAQNECVDPIRISNYIESGGYGALIKALEQADEVFDASRRVPDSPDHHATWASPSRAHRRISRRSIRIPHPSRQSGCRPDSRYLPACRPEGCT